jgi:hypothetical protein
MRSRRHAARALTQRKAIMYRVDEQPSPASDVHGSVLQALYCIANANRRVILDNDAVALIAAHEGIPAYQAWEIIDDLEANGVLWRMGLTQPTGRWSS